MFLFGHIGLTMGVVRACDILASVMGRNSSGEPVFSLGVDTFARKRRLNLYQVLSGVRRRIGSIDYRIVLLGSLLPVIVDKPLWLFETSHIFLAGRGYVRPLQYFWLQSSIIWHNG